jgi:sugar phosphate isomerase/epimerase
MVRKNGGIPLFYAKNPTMLRRNFLKSSTLALAGASGTRLLPPGTNQKNQGFGCTLALNAYSFNDPLLAGEMSLEELFLFARETGFEGVDLTAYYIPGYPEVPEDRVLFGIRKSAFRLGLALSGTGVRNDFTLADPEKLEKEVELVKGWVVAAAKLGAPQVRVFAGVGRDNTEPREVVKQRIMGQFRECADFASKHGIMIAFQNHYDYIRSTSEILEILGGIDSEWFGLMLDIGSVEGPDPYPGIGKLIPHAITWQVKEQVKSDNGSLPTDFEKLMKMVKEHNYRGYFPLETLGEGNPREKVRALYDRVVRWVP